MNPKLIFSDIDGTLLNTHRELSNYTISVLKRVREKVPFLLVSARMPKQMTHLQQQFSDQVDPMICYNGALVVLGKQIIHSQEISLDYVQWMLNYNDNNDKKIHISLFNNNSWFVENYDYWAKREQENTKVSPEILSNREVFALWENQKVGPHKITCMGEASLISEMYNALYDRFSNELHLYRSKDTYIEIAHKNVSKLTGIQSLIDCCYKGVSLKEVMAFGDNYNDIEMIKSVGYGVAVENAIDPLKEVAYTVTGHHKQDGVGRYLSHFFNV